MKNATPRITAGAFKYTDICQFDPDITPETAFSPTSISKRRIHSNVNLSQGISPEYDHQKMSTTLKRAALTCSMSKIPSKYKFGYNCGNVLKNDLGFFN
jgi:hypothetical protein